MPAGQSVTAASQENPESIIAIAAQNYLGKFGILGGACRRRVVNVVGTRRQSVCGVKSRDVDGARPFVAVVVSKIERAGQPEQRDHRDVHDCWIAGVDDSRCC